ncbi:hypothetical protein DID88_006419 [Monilinia fructigena]|uniref:DNA repair protein RAD16 n=1 Tax=Monilinia fructigena TaxID=38457 RepID=A0A395ID66_9HELO|nr:hypothetical protein DID88_006419 [Monilinia fructigena]
MAPTGRPRSRPKKVADPGKNDGGVKGCPTSSRLSAFKQVSNLELDELSSPASLSKSTPKNYIITDSDNDSLSDLPSPSRIGEYISAKKFSEKGKGKSTESLETLSSVSTSNENIEGSGYSTPETSGIATPASTKNPVPPPTTTVSTRRGRSQTTNPIQSNSACIIARARALENSMYSLNSSNKRKFAESEDGHLDDDNTPDAQLARAMQEQEYAASASLVAPSSLGSRRASRNLQSSKLTFNADFSDDDDNDDEYDDSFRPKPSHAVKKAKVEPKFELSSTSNAVNFETPNRRKVVLDIGDDDDFIDIDSDSDSDSTKHKLIRSSSSTKGSNRFQKSRISTGELIQKNVEPAFPQIKPEGIGQSQATSALTDLPSPSPEESTFETDEDSMLGIDTDSDAFDDEGSIADGTPATAPAINSVQLMNHLEDRATQRSRKERVGWMRAMEKTAWGGGLLGDEMGMGKTIQAVSLIMSDFPAKQPSLVLVPPVALMQWQQEIADYTDGTLKTFVFHGSNSKAKGVTAQELKRFNVILLSYNTLESMYRKQEKGFKSRTCGGMKKEKSQIHQIHFHRVILDEAHSIKQRNSGSAKACFALKANHKWCLSGTPLQNRIGEFFSLVRFLDIKPFACYFCKQCPCSTLEWDMDSENRCRSCNHGGMQHVSVFNQELLNPIQKFGNNGPGKEAFQKLRILTDRFMLRRVKRDHSSSMELPAKEIYVDRQFFGEEENDFAGSIMNNGARRFETYVAQGVLLNNYANIFGLIMQMRQVADHPDLILKKNGEGGQNVIVCCICDETAEEAIRSACRHEFCRECAKDYLRSSEIFHHQPNQDGELDLIIKIEALVHDLYQLRSKNSSTKSIIFSQFTTMLQLVEWRLRRAGITTVMLDGSMSPTQRQASINHFMTDVNVECFLVSLKAGGVALNLTEANKVFIVDPWWNPAAEWQSADRCHRIGQARPCSITRLCIEDSVESRMVLLQEKKANMIHGTIGADESAMQNLTPEDMQFLFRGN